MRIGGSRLREDASRTTSRIGIVVLRSCEGATAISPFAVTPKYPAPQRSITYNSVESSMLHGSGGTMSGAVLTGRKNRTLWNAQGTVHGAQRRGAGGLCIVPCAPCTPSDLLRDH